MRKYYPGLTLFKFAGAVLVVMSHIRTFPLQASLDARLPYFSMLCAVIVPCFYVMAGFLACKGWSRAAQPQRYVAHYVFWLAGVYLLFFLLLVGSDFILFCYSGIFPRNPNYYLELFFITGPYPQFWFLPPLFAAVGLGFLADKYGFLRTALVLAAGGYLLATCVVGPLRVGTNYLLGDLPLFHSHYFLWVEVFFKNYLGGGLPYVLAGICVARRETAFLRIPKVRFLLLSLLAAVLEVTALQRLYPEGYTQSMLLSQVPLTLLLFYGLLKLKSGWVQPYHAYLRQLSLFLFFAHWPLMVLNGWFMGTPYYAFSARQAALCMVLTFGQILLLERLSARLLQGRKKKALARVRAEEVVSGAAVQQPEKAGVE